MSNKPIRSYVLRQGRQTPAQIKAFDQHADTYLLDPNQSVASYASVFDRDAPCVLEIGFGMGDSLLEMAVLNPDVDFIGSEVHAPGVGALMRGAAKEAVNNLRIYHSDIYEVLNALPAESLSQVNVFFPDPWPKKKHHKRRLVQADFFNAIADKLQSQGCLYLVTDWEDYAQWMVEQSKHQTHFHLCEQKPAHLLPRVTTKYERRAWRLGHRIAEFVFQKS